MRINVLVYLLLGLVAIVAATSMSEAAPSPARTESIPTWLSLYGVAINGEGRSYAVGGKGSVFTSTDEGKNWSPEPIRERSGSALFQDLDLYDVKFAPDGKNGWIVGEKGLIFNTSDGGAKWEEQQSGVKVNLFRLAVADAQHAHAVGDDGTLLNTEDGKTWTRQQLNHITYFDVTFTDTNTGWAVGEFSTVLGTADGGKTWQVRYGGNLSDYQAGPYLSVVFSDRDHGYVLGLNGDMVVTSDGGKTWQKQNLPEPKAMYAGAIVPGAGIWLGGEDGQLLNLSNGGKWTARRAVFNDVTDIAFSPKFGLAVGLNGTVLRTEDGGREWHPVR